MTHIIGNEVRAQNLHYLTKQKQKKTFQKQFKLLLYKGNREHPLFIGEVVEKGISTNTHDD